MRNSKIMLSVFMVFVIILISVVPAFATDTKRTSPVVIKEDLATVMENSDANDKIKVYIWYKDIDQNEVDVLTTKATGLTPESCAVITEFPSAELLTSLEKGEVSAQKQMDNYMERTKADRKKERENTDNYAKKHMEIATAKYNKKSENVRESISLSDNDTVFSSELAPLIIAEMTKEEIEDAVDNPNIEEINLYYECEVLEPSDYVEEPSFYNVSYSKQSLGVNTVNNIYGLTGAGVNVGLVEKNIPGIWEHDSVDFGIDYDEITVIENPNYPITPSKTTQADEHWHSNNSYRVMAHRDYGIAANINKYATIFRQFGTYTHLEELIKLEQNSNNVIDVIEANIAFKIPEYIVDESTGDTINNPSYLYTDYDKYFDHIVSEHNITVVVAGGNKKESFGEKVCAPGMASNVITVSAYDNNNDDIDTNDLRCAHSWRNSTGNQRGCEKPDVVVPHNFYHGGTSESSPALTAIIALMLELKPSLSLHPEAVKAIVLASCHRKVLPSSSVEPTETMEQGITERQGAGVPNAWTMASIISQGSYGVGALNGGGTTINFEQPPYSAENMNVSVTWIKENTHSINEETNEPECDDSSDITEAPYYNIDLGVLHSDELVTSTLFYSSTEMCYLPLDDTDFKYQIQLTNSSSSTGSIRYGYAWSTNNMYSPISTNQDGIYYIKNAASERYITYNTASTTPQAVHRSVNAQFPFSDANRWIIQQNNNAYNISSGYGSTKLYLGQSSTLSGTSYTSQLNAVAQDINILYNDDGTVSFLNSTSDRILTYSGSNLIWTTYNSSTSLSQKKNKWFIEKVNYLCGDANMDGSLETGGTAVNEDGESYALPGLDLMFIQDYLVGIESMNNLQLFLSDMDKDGEVSIMDAVFVNQFADKKYFVFE